MTEPGSSSPELSHVGPPASGDPLAFLPFTALPDDARRALAAAASVMRLSPGERLVTQGDPADACFVLRSGLVRVEADGAVLDFFSPPALIGEMAIVEGAARSASVIAEAESELLRIDAQAFAQAFAAHETFASAVRDRVAELAANTFLRRDSPFGDLPREVLDALGRQLRPVRFAAGATLVTEGATDDDIYLIRRGRVEVIRRAQDTERRLATVGPGSFVGEIAALAGTPRNATVRALEAVEAYRIAGAEVRPLVRQHAQLVERFGDALTTRHRPRAAAEVTALPCPDDRSCVILRNDANGSYLKVSREAHAIFEDLDGERNLRDLVLRHFQRTNEMDPHGVFRTAATLQAAGFASAARLAGDAEAHPLRARILDLILAARLEVRSADRAASAIYRIARPLVNAPSAVAAFVLGLVGAVVFVGEFRDLAVDAFGLGGIVVAWAGLFLAGLGHELAHAMACKAFGSRLGRAGIGMLWLTPIMYVDTTDTWTLGKRERILVNAAGPLFNFALGGAAAIGARLAEGTAGDLLLWLAGMNYLAVVFNLSPLLEFDGYYVLTDISNTPMLRRRALRFVFRDLVERPRLPRSRFEWGLVLLSAAVVVYIVVLTAFFTLTVPGAVRSLFTGRLPAEWLLPAGLLAAALAFVLTIWPLFDDVRAARRTTELSDASAAGSAPS